MTRRIALLLCSIVSVNTTAENQVQTDPCKPSRYWENRIQGDPDIHALTASRSNMPYFISVYGVDFGLPGLRTSYSCMEETKLVRPIKGTSQSYCDDRYSSFNKDARNSAIAFNRVMRHARPDLLKGCSVQSLTDAS